MVKNILKGWYYRITGKYSDLYNNRYKVCKDCPHKVSFGKVEICSVCGCVLKAKLLVPEEKCLMKLW